MTPACKYAFIAFVLSVAAQSALVWRLFSLDCARNLLTELYLHANALHRGQRMNYKQGYLLCLLKFKRETKFPQTEIKGAGKCLFFFFYERKHFFFPQFFFMLLCF